ncbi:MAG: hypothetical protein H6R11_1605 [Proteobacteria bacterium]|jgi:hypothetical protein|nr:hypothetical protein [Pseudomonadota bacterium]MBS1172876.1 hypothetical protein [Pseudomonadota bacterium]
MLTVKEASYRGKPASVFWVTQGTETIGEVMTALQAEMKERFRCGDSPRAGHMPMVGDVAFIKTALFAHPAALVTLTNELSCLFGAISVQVSPESYVVSVVSESAPAAFKLGEIIPVAEVKEHADPWSKS